MLLINWPVFILFLLFPIYVVFRLETIARKLVRIERRQMDLERENIKIHNARMIDNQQLKDKDSGDLY
ncbi:hypothetical protein PAESOLCIP111_06591 [Paenibacillus solanacearum]|uniref:Uncharacterized protein n=1 Tax=Paenibacillus solanacearum TaxID=2048548 RepID=A0A916KAT2_9BACL|nr:hypothetical protein PAESOLCIP111_06591 [Paenibacillus solanacearum]